MHCTPRAPLMWARCAHAAHCCPHMCAHKHALLLLRGATKSHSRPSSTSCCCSHSLATQARMCAHAISKTHKQPLCLQTHTRAHSSGGSNHMRHCAQAQENDAPAHLIHRHTSVKKRVNTRAGVNTPASAARTRFPECCRGGMCLKMRPKRTREITPDALAIHQQAPLCNL